MQSSAHLFLFCFIDRLKDDAKRFMEHATWASDLLYGVKCDGTERHEHVCRGNAQTRQKCNSTDWHFVEILSSVLEIPRSNLQLFALTDMFYDLLLLVPSARNISGHFTLSVYKM
jgi:hypothetical protein